jgi:hypothetical protein
MFNKIKAFLIKNNESDYGRAFNEAVNITKRHGLGKFNKLKLTDVRLINDKALDDLHRDHTINQIDPRQLFSMCFHTHIQLQHIINKVFNTESILTLGYVEYDSGKRFHYQHLNEILGRIENRSILKDVNMHCWLTLPTSEIIDLTLPTTQAIIEGNVQSVGRIITIHTEELKGMRYVPQILGREYLHLAGIYDKNIPIGIL